MKITRQIMVICILGAFLLAGTGCGRSRGAGSGAEKQIAYYVDPMNPANLSDHPGKAPCGMDMVPVYVGDKNAQGIRIDPAMIQNIGVMTAEVKKQNLKREIRTSGTVALNESKVYTLSTKFMGWAEKLHVSYTGERVVQGQPLLDIYSPELVSTQEEYLQARRYADALPPDASAEALRGARELVESARARLLNWDIPDSEIRTLTARGTVQKTMTLRSPDKGVVLEKMVESGKQVEPGMVLYRIADLSMVWVMADIYERDLSWVQTGQQTQIELSALPGKLFKGRVAYLSPVLDPTAKTAQARIEVSNTPDLQLKPGMFATVRIISPAALDVVAIPEQAVIHSGDRNIAVIALPNGYFTPREVQLGVAGGGYVQVLQGVTVGEKIVTSAQFLIDSESNLKNAVQLLGAGHSPDNSTGAEPTAQPATHEQRGNGSMPGMEGEK
ncbi:MAG: efflux RND transporter periplasmic adaptor subunit [Candidatus Firestonebacteria bacterium]|nr:efflux RND transporter periplasmic adaptor subunit [Candidatus Firestonebacteria bacterium]